MKKILYIFCSVLITFSCQDFNEDNFSEYNDWETPKNIIGENMTMVDADYTIIVNALRANKNKADSVLATKLNSAKKFSADLKAAELIPYLLASKYYSADVKSAVKVTYAYDNSRNTVVSGLSGTGYVVSNDDYKSVWGDPYATAFTPAKSPEAKLPGILATHFPSATDGTYKTVEYYYSEQEPTVSTVTKDFISEKFDAYAANDVINKNSWITKALKGSKVWTAGFYATTGNTYAQTSSYGSGEINDIWMVSPRVDLSSAVSPKLSFNVQVSYYVGNCLTVLVSENFDGNDANIASATWTDITSSFTIPQTTGGWSATDFSSAGIANLSAYAGKKIYVAFRYQGDAVSATKVTTNIRLDNVELYEQVTGISVAKKKTTYASYVYSASSAKWLPVTGNIYTLQPEDYTDMGLSGTLTTAQAPNYLPTFLANKYKFLQNGTEYVVVYRTANNTYYADKLVKANDVWTISSFVEMLTDQYVLALIDGKKTWIYDPTIITAITSADYQVLVDHVKENEAAGNEGILDSRGNAEFYYGFNAYYPNVTYRNVDRIKDNTFPAEGTLLEQIAFMNQRTIDGLSIILSIKYPNAQPLVNGVDQLARITGIQIYSDPTEGAPTRRYWSYTFQCVGDKEWKFVRRESTDGVVEIAK